MLRRYSANGMETLPLDKTVISIGSGPDCDIVIPDPNLAQKHAEIEYHPLPQAYFLKDLDTLSGTTFNGEPVYGMVELKPNNTIRFGYGPEYVFELPKVTSKGNIRKITKGHENCLTAKESTVSLPVVGVKERKILPALPTKQYSHPPPRPRKVRLSMDDPRTPSEEKEKRSFLTTERLSPISRVRSASMDPSISKNYNSILHKTNYNWNEIWDKRELVNNETKDVETIEMIEKSSEEVDTDSIVARLEESARKSPSKDGNSWEEQKAICAIKSEKGEVERASFSKDEREEDSSLEDGIHSISTAPPSVCSSQKTSTDTEQLDHLHELARNIRDVFQKLDLQAEMSGDEGGVLKSNVAQNEDSCGTDTPPSTPVEPISGSPPAEMLRQDGHDTNEQLQPAMKKNSMEDDSSSTVSISLPTIISKSIDVVESKCVDTEEPVEDDLPLPSVTKHKTLGDGGKKDDLTICKRQELDEPITGEDTGKRKGSSEFWRLATNLGRALALEQEINKTREENLRESEKRASVMESLMIGIHEILENIKTEHEKLDAESN
ncbi:hypothetical protein QR680_001587 [Steinernema hermaphroditum]|uniref:FHA domain-containing protein n=1 Tax=Steinernema hermaphroditum TaxID=289476 RepID=A0AA39LG87_9BILA|nr:hypothetical protein QR680_001587 [Steinernema hermaphroditum]